MPSSLANPRHAPLSRSVQADRRDGSRYEVYVSVEVLTADGVPLSAEMTNISGSGFRARSAMALAKGTKLVVRFNGRLPRKAQVAWQKGEEIGCRFVRPLSQQQLAEVAAR